MVWAHGSRVQRPARERAQRICPAFTDRPPPLPRCAWAAACTRTTRTGRGGWATSGTWCASRTRLRWVGVGGCAQCGAGAGRERERCGGGKLAGGASLPACPAVGAAPTPRSHFCPYATLPPTLLRTADARPGAHRGPPDARGAAQGVYARRHAAAGCRGPSGPTVLALPRGARLTRAASPARQLRPAVAEAEALRRQAAGLVAPAAVGPPFPLCRCRTPTLPTHPLIPHPTRRPTRQPFVSAALLPCSRQGVL